MDWRWIQYKSFLVLRVGSPQEVIGLRRARKIMFWSRHFSADARFFFFQFFFCLASIYYLLYLRCDKDSIVPVSLCEAAFPTSTHLQYLFFPYSYNAMIGGALSPSLCCMSDLIFSTPN